MNDKVNIKLPDDPAPLMVEEYLWGIKTKENEKNTEG